VSGLQTFSQIYLYITPVTAIIVTISSMLAPRERWFMGYRAVVVFAVNTHRLQRKRTPSEKGVNKNKCAIYAPMIGIPHTNPRDATIS
jgi:hypothetical protein